MFRDKSINLFFLCSIGMLLGFTNLKAQFYNGTQGVFGKTKYSIKIICGAITNTKSLMFILTMKLKI